MRTIYKYMLPIAHDVDILLPKGAEVLSVGHQKRCLGMHYISMWAIVDPDQAGEMRHFDVEGTGSPLSEGQAKAGFIGTVLQEDGDLVWHVFEVSR